MKKSGLTTAIVCPLAAVLSFSYGISLHAQDATGSASSADAGSTQASTMDKHFVTEALEGGQAEVQLGQLAQQNGSSDDVKNFGQKMVIDHTNLGNQMQPIAQRLGITPPAQLAAHDQALLNKLQALSGQQFDRAYIQAMVADHQKDLQSFRKEAKNGKDPSVKDAASQGSKVIAEHLQMIQQIASAHNVTAGGSANTAAGGATQQP